MNWWLSFVVISLFLPTSLGHEPTDDRDAILSIVEDSYVRGIHLEADPDLIRSGFHVSFRMFVRAEDGVSTVSRDEWIARVEKRKAAGDASGPPVHYELELLDVTGSSAAVRVEIGRGDARIFTDYILLYRLPDGWKIVAKTFHRHSR